VARKRPGADVRRHRLKGARRWLALAITAISLSAVVISIGAAFAVWAVDRDAFGSYDDALWWAIVTVGTVGYGDVVPNNDAGRSVAAALILFSMAFFPVLTGLVTAALIDRRDRQRDEAGDDEADDRHAVLLDRLRSIDERLRRLEDRG